MTQTTSQLKNLAWMTLSRPRLRDSLLNHLEPGRRVWVIGPKDSGKSTLIQTLSDKYTVHPMTSLQSIPSLKQNKDKPCILTVSTDVIDAFGAKSVLEELKKHPSVPSVLETDDCFAVAHARRYDSNSRLIEVGDLSKVDLAALLRTQGFDDSVTTDYVYQLTAGRLGLLARLIPNLQVEISTDSSAGKGAVSGPAKDVHPQAHEFASPAVSASSQANDVYLQSVFNSGHFSSLVEEYTSRLVHFASEYSSSSDSSLRSLSAVMHASREIAHILELNSYIPLQTEMSDLRDPVVVELLRRKLLYARLSSNPRVCAYDPIALKVLKHWSLNYLASSFSAVDSLRSALTSVRQRVGNYNIL